MYEPELRNVDAICLTTNGFLKSNKHAVMGRGVAKQAAMKWPELPYAIGKILAEKGNHVAVAATGDVDAHVYSVVMFPVKPVSEVCALACSNVVKHKRADFMPGDIVPGWACLANTNIIRRSCEELVKLTDERKWLRVVLPKPGAGAGELNYEQLVEPILVKYLDDRFYVIDLPGW